MVTAAMCAIPGCARDAVARGWCMLHYKRHRVRGLPLPTGTEPAVGDPDGHGRYGVMQRDEHAALCHECGGWFVSVGAHLGPVHGMTAAEYRAAHGLPRTQPLTSLARSREVSEAAVAQVGSPGWRRFEAARDPQAAADARDMSQPSAPGTSVARAARAVDGRLPGRVAAARVCPYCGATYTGPARSCGAPACAGLVRSERNRAGMATRFPSVDAEQAAELRRATGEALAVLVRELQRQGFSSASIGRALGRSGAWMTTHYPRT